MLTETRLGRPMDDALAEMAERIGSKNFEFVDHRRDDPAPGRRLARRPVRHGRRHRPPAAAVRAQDQGLTAMGRMSAYVLVGMPFFCSARVTLMNREYMRPLYTTSTGHKLMVIGAA